MLMERRVKCVHTMEFVQLWSCSIVVPLDVVLG